MYIGDKVEVRDKRVPFEPLTGTIEAINNTELYIRLGEPYYSAVWIDRREYDVKEVRECL